MSDGDASTRALYPHARASNPYSPSHGDHAHLVSTLAGVRALHP